MISEKMELSKRATESQHDSDMRALKAASLQKRQLHELEHYVDHSKPSGIAPLQLEPGHGQGQGQGGKKQRLADTRASAVRVSEMRCHCHQMAPCVHGMPLHPDCTAPLLPV